MGASPVVEVLLATFNGERFLREHRSTLYSRRITEISACSRDAMEDQ
jgi:hypothetical protein